MQAGPLLIDRACPNLPKPSVVCERPAQTNSAVSSAQRLLQKVIVPRFQEGNVVTKVSVSVA